MSVVEYEYCVMHEAYPDEPHRSRLTKEECESWVQEWLDDGGRGGAFYVARRAVGTWEAI